MTLSRKTLFYQTNKFVFFAAGNGEQGGSVGATPTVGQGASGKVGGVGKKKTAGRPGTTLPGSSSTEEKDPDGSFRVPGYRGVWVNKNGKHFVKINGVRLTDDKTETGKVQLFDNIDDVDLELISKLQNIFSECYSGNIINI